MLGALHGPRPKGRPSYFSNQAPRTFAPKPGYAVKFWRERGLAPTHVDVLSVITDRANRFLSESLPAVSGSVALADSRTPSAYDGIPSPSWVITSPPYYGMTTYVPDQWLRHWFLGGPDQVVYRQPEAQLQHKSAHQFADQMAMVWSNVHRISNERTRLVVRFGGIHDREADPRGILKASLESSEWRILTARAVPDADHGRRQVRQFCEAPRKGVVEYDFYCCPR